MPMSKRRKTRGPGRERFDAGTAATVLVAVKFTGEDVLRLDALVLARSRALSASAGGVRARATRGSVLRELVRREAGVAVGGVEEVSHG
jgi:hypothetical protein